MDSNPYYEAMLFTMREAVKAEGNTPDAAMRTLANVGKEIAGLSMGTSPRRWDDLKKLHRIMGAIIKQVDDECQ